MVYWVGVDKVVEGIGMLMVKGILVNVVGGGGLFSVGGM